MEENYKSKSNTYIINTKPNKISGAYEILIINKETNITYFEEICFEKICQTK